MIVLEKQEYATLKQVQEETGYKPNTVYVWLRRQNIPVQRLGNLVLVARQDVDKYIRHRKGV